MEKHEMEKNEMEKLPIVIYWFKRESMEQDYDYFNELEWADVLLMLYRAGRDPAARCRFDGTKAWVEDGKVVCGAGWKYPPVTGSFKRHYRTKGQMVIK
jgi:hypothetical protein